MNSRQVDKNYFTGKSGGRLQHTMNRWIDERLWTTNSMKDKKELEVAQEKDYWNPYAITATAAKAHNLSILNGCVWALNISIWTRNLPLVNIIMKHNCEWMQTWRMTYIKI